MAFDQSYIARTQQALGSKTGQAFSRGVGRLFGFEYAHGKSMGFLGRKMSGGMFGAGVAGFGMRALGPLFLGMSIRHGYQQGGVLGAAKEGIKEMALWGAFEAGAAFLTNPITIGIAGTFAAGYGYYKLGETSRKHRKRLRNLEMGSDLVDRFGTMTTMRQRSLAAIQRTHVNGRLALGNESLLLSQAYR